MLSAQLLSRTDGELADRFLKMRQLGDRPPKATGAGDLLPGLREVCHVEAVLAPQGGFDKLAQMGDHPNGRSPHRYSWPPLLSQSTTCCFPIGSYRLR